jgi:hypothetical protein
MALRRQGSQPRGSAAQIAAGIQPITVICKSKHTIPAIGRLIVKKASQGGRMPYSPVEIDPSAMCCGWSGAVVPRLGQ